MATASKGRSRLAPTPPPLGATIRTLARKLLLLHEDEDPDYRDAVRIACEIDDDDTHVAIKAHRLLVEYTAGFALEAGQVDDEVVPLIAKLHDFINSFPGHEFYVNGEWHTYDQVWDKKQGERGDRDISRIVALLRTRQQPWVSAPPEAP